MINQLASSGVREAQALLERFGPATLDGEPEPEDENRPLRRGPTRRRVRRRDVRDRRAQPQRAGDPGLPHQVDQGGEGELPGSRARRPGDAARRHRRRGRAVRARRRRGTRPVASRCRRACACRSAAGSSRRASSSSTSPRKLIEVKDFYELVGRVILPSHCYGKLGGKSAGLFLAKKIVEKSPRRRAARHDQGAARPGTSRRTASSSSSTTTTSRTC